jgi:hypothetical protein
LAAIYFGFFAATLIAAPRRPPLYLIIGLLAAVVLLVYLQLHPPVAAALLIALSIWWSNRCPEGLGADHEHFAFLSDVRRRIDLCVARGALTVEITHHRPSDNLGGCTKGRSGVLNRRPSMSRR